MNFGIKADTRELERAMDAVTRESLRADHEVVMLNGRTLLRAIVYNTPRSTGNGRAGWWPAWSGLGMAGTPGTPVAEGTHVLRKQQYTAAGTFTDRSRARPEAFVEFTNTSSVQRKGGKQFRYLFVSNARGKSADWMQKAADEATFKFDRQHARLLRKHSAR